MRTPNLSTLRRAFSAHRRYTTHEQMVAALAMVLLPTIASMNKVLGFHRARRFLRRLDGRSSKSFRTSDERLVHLVELAARRGPFRANCLHRSTLSWWLLLRRGTSTSICFGVRPRPDKERPDFHAWLECDGVVLNDRDDVAEIFFRFEGTPDRPMWS